MKHVQYVILILAQIVGLCPLGVAQTAATSPRGNGGDSFTNFLVHSAWPAAGNIRSSKVDQALVRRDVEELDGLLKRIIRPRYLPTAEQQRDVLACPELRDGNDYLLLRYSPANGIEMEIQDGRALHVAVVHRITDAPSSDIQTFVRRAAAEFLNFPARTRAAADDVHVWVSALDLGASKCGTVAYGKETIPPPNWCSHIRWWSDGQRCLFELVRTEPDRNIGLRPGPPPDVGKPKRFLFRR